jgi:UDP-N-acetylglucosamine 1-carboxyvinyltransferase
MDRLRIVGGTPLRGTIRISGAKNAALPLMAASLLTDEPLRLANLPVLADIGTLAEVLAHLGVDIRVSNGNTANRGRVMELRSAAIRDTTAPYDLVRKMRASVLVLGPLVARHGQACVSLPGGCAIGPRPVDLHLRGLEELGATIELQEGYIRASAPGGLRGATIRLPQVSVGATENLMMAATLAAGETVIDNAAREPEVSDLARCLIAMGARIEGVGTGELRILGVRRLGGAEHAVLPDRIEAGTYAMAAVATGGGLELQGADRDLLGVAVEKFEEADVEVAPTEGGMRVRRRNGLVHGVDVMTQPYPGFPTDLQAQMMALMTVAERAAMITETIFENRFMHVPELARMGARITVHGSSALVRGAERLTGAQVMATDLRASGSLVLAALAAEGETIINRVYHLDRGYERLEEKLAACGARVERLSD